jgi:hypothetical protein
MIYASNAEMVAAVGGLVAAAAAVGTFAVATIAAFYAKHQVEAARGQLQEAERLRAEQSQPYVAVYMESSEADWHIVNLVVKNFGSTAAYDVRTNIEPELMRTDGQGGVQPVGMFEALPTLVPGQSWVTVFDVGTERVKSDLPDLYEVSVQFTDSQGQKYELDYELDWRTYKERLVVTVYSAHHAAKALREIAQQVKKWTEPGGQGGLRAFTRDGAVRDERAREYHERRKQEHETLVQRVLRPSQGRASNEADRAADDS